MVVDERNCSVLGCTVAHYCRGFCRRHYRRWMKTGNPLNPRRTENGDARRWLEAHVDESDGPCLIWPFVRNQDGYALFGRHSRASRFMCEMVHGAAPSSAHYAAHECGNGHTGCVHPKHLFWKTPKENMVDTLKHGTLRGPYGAMKFTAQQVQAIRKDIRSNARIAADFSVDKSTIWAIKNRHTWAHLP